MMEKQLDFSVSGTVLDSRSGMPLRNLRLRAYDKDLFRYQLLGDSITDENGRYDIRFRHSDFTGALLKLERSPDIFLEVFDEDENIVFSTRKDVLRNADKHSTLDLKFPYLKKDEAEKNVRYVMGTAVNMKHLAVLSTKDLLNAYKYLRYPERKIDNIELIRKTFPDLGHRHSGVAEECGEGLNSAIRLLLRERGADADLEDADDFEPGTTVLHFYTANMDVQYTLDAGSPDRLTGVFAAVPAADANFDFPIGGQNVGIVRADPADLHPDNTGVTVPPTYIQQIGLMSEYSLSRYVNAQFGFQDPRNGAPRFIIKVRVPSAGLGETAANWNYVVVGMFDNDLVRFGTVPHEMFHQVQYRYNDTLFVAGGIYGILREGGARLIEDCIYDGPNRYIGSASSDDLFDNPGLSLIDVGGVRTPIRYAAGLFWKYIAEHHSPNTGAASEPAVGVETYRILLEESASGAAGYTYTALRNMKNRLPWYGTFDQFSYYDGAATELNSHETTWGNYLAANYLHRLMQPGDPDYDQRFDYLEDDDATGAVILNTLSPATEVINISQGTSASRMVIQNPAAAKYYELRPNAASAPRMLRINFTVTSGMTHPLVQIIRLGAGDTFVDIHRSDRTNYSKTINMEGLSKVIVIVGSTEEGGNFTIHFDEQASASDIMVTRWNSRAGKEYEADPRGWAWTWISPDIMVDTDNNGADDVNVFFGENNKLKVRLRNRGNIDVDNILIDFWYQKATPFLSTAAWTPVVNLDGLVQQLTDRSLAAGAEAWFAVDWCPPDDGSGDHHYCVKVQVTRVGDPNTDNKIAFRNFNNLVPGEGDLDFRGLIRYTNWPPREQRLHIIPRDRQWTMVLQNPEVLPQRKTFGLKHDSFASRIKLGAPEDLGFAKLKVKKASLKEWDGKNTSDPDKTGAYYPVDPLTLPPGIKASEIITLAHIADGKTIGGVSYRIGKGKS